MRVTLTSRSRRRRWSTPLDRHRAFLAERRRTGHGVLRVHSVPRMMRRAMTHTLSFVTNASQIYSLRFEAPQTIGLSTSSAALLRTRELQSIHVFQAHEHVRHTLFEHARAILLRVCPAGYESRALARGSLVQRIARAGVFPKLTLTVVRSASPVGAAPAQAIAMPSATRHTPPPSPRAPIFANAIRPLPADELLRVTEHVLRTLDRRVLSWRERTGQL